jgi:oligopeptidase B
VNVLAKDQKYCSTGAVKVSPSQKLLAYSADFTGGETYKLFVKDLETDEIVDHDESLETSGCAVWGADDQVLYYMKMDDTHRPYQLYKRVIGNSDEDELLIEEKDGLFWCGISKSLDGHYLFFDTGSKETSEIHFLYLKGSECQAGMRCSTPRQGPVRCGTPSRHVVDLHQCGWITQHEINDLLRICKLSRQMATRSRSSK